MARTRKEAILTFIRGPTHPHNTKDELMDVRLKSKDFEKRFLQGVAPSFSDLGSPYYPCSATAKDGQRYPKIIFMRESLARHKYDMDAIANRRILPLDIAEVSEPEHRINRKFVNKANALGETAMGSIAFILTMKDKRRIAYWGPEVSPGDIDFLELPLNFSNNEIRKIEFLRPPPPEDVARINLTNRNSLKFCFY